MTSSWKQKTRDVLRGISGILRDVLILKPTGPTRVQVGITTVSLGYLGYVWWLERRSPFLPRSSSSSSFYDEKEKRKRMNTRDDREQEEEEQDEEEKKLQRELGFTTFAEWKERGFIPDSKKIKARQEEEEFRQSPFSSSSSSSVSSSSV